MFKLLNLQMGGAAVRPGFSPCCGCCGLRWVLCLEEALVNMCSCCLI